MVSELSDSGPCVFTHAGAASVLPYEDGGNGSGTRLLVGLTALSRAFNVGDESTWVGVIYGYSNLPPHLIEPYCLATKRSDVVCYE